MLPVAYHTPAALLLLMAGALACFAGHRLFRVVLAVFGFLLGAFAASSFFGSGSSTTLVAAAVLGGLAGAVLLWTAYVVSIALLGAALGAVTAHLVMAALGREPGIVVLVLFSIAGSVGATYVQRYFVIVGTAFGGAWTLLLGALAFAGDRRAFVAAAARDVWVLYPLDPAPGRLWVPVAWIALGIVGVAVQLRWTGGHRGRVGRGRRK